MSNPPTPPKLPLRFFRWFCHPDYQEDIEGDLLERFERRLAHNGLKNARWEFSKDVLRLFRPGIIRSIAINSPLTYQDMFYHNLLLSFRGFKRYKSTFFINLIGLASGLACALLIFLWVNDELSIDKFHSNDEQLYQIMLNAETPSGIRTLEWTPGPLAKTLVEETPEVKHATAVYPPGSYTAQGILSVEDTRIKAEAKYVGKSYFTVFSYDLIEGDKNEVLQAPNNIVISASLAMKLYNTTTDVVGKTIEWDQGEYSGSYLISGIFQEAPVNASVHFDVVLNFELLERNRPELAQWSYNDPSTYVVLKEQAQLAPFADKIVDLIKTKDPESRFTLITRKYSDQHLYGNYEDGKVSGGRIVYVRLFGIIAIIILLIACINFMNLATARASRRFKELGVKKAIGAKRSTLAVQYLTESTLIALFSLFVALLLVFLLLPQFNQITAKQLGLIPDQSFIGVLAVITLVTGLIAGSYPAFYLSGFNPIKVLKGSVLASAGSLWIRKGLVVFQFTISIILIVSVLVVYQQMQHVQNKNLGLEKDNVVTFGIDNLEGESLNTFLNEIKRIPGTINVSAILGDLTSGDHNNTTGLTWEGLNPGEEIDFTDIKVSNDFFETMGINVVAGRTFSQEFNTESSKLILNQKAIDLMGLDDPVGKTVTLWGQDRQIIGVVSDFHFESLYSEVKPCFFRLATEPRNVLVKIRAGSEKETLAQLQDFYQDYKGTSLEYQFLDETYQRLYASEQRVATLSKYFAGIAIHISCLGLFGLAAFTAERRLKEIGIRKILGASEFSVVRLLSNDFTKMVLVAIVIGLPISYLVAYRWLENFAFSIELKWWYFASAGLAALLTAWFTVGLQTAKAALVKPVECLKDE